LLRLWAFTRAPGAQANAARGVLRGMLARGQGGALVHLALGMDAWQHEDKAAALVHLEQAYALPPEMGLVANNLAWALASAQPPDLPRALGLIDSVVQRWPADPVFRDTRGQILARLGRWREALTDLQVALPIYGTKPEFHRRLADCYRHLEMPAMAQEHEQLAQQQPATPALR
jgi:predicted Zn-dependent protease